MAESRPSPAIALAAFVLHMASPSAVAQSKPQTYIPNGAQARLRMEKDTPCRALVVVDSATLFVDPRTKAELAVKPKLFTSYCILAEPLSFDNRVFHLLCKELNDKDAGSIKSAHDPDLSYDALAWISSDDVILSSTGDFV